MAPPNGPLQARCIGAGTACSIAGEERLETHQPRTEHSDKRMCRCSLAAFESAAEQAVVNNHDDPAAAAVAAATIIQDSEDDDNDDGHLSSCC